ncbi:hypothetical protein [Rhodococcus globerulus]|uniref:hypothetical protein n=1 Tax=Rhodococcus globerulus TaxID=33008 RepID=UPI003017189B
MAVKETVQGNSEANRAVCVRYRVASEIGAAVTRDRSGSSTVVDHLPVGTVVVVAEHSTDEVQVDRVRIAAPAGWVDSQSLKTIPQSTAIGPTDEEYERLHLQPTPGDYYGLTFPPTADALRKIGAKFLTCAFQRSGAITSANRVTAIVDLEPVAHDGASESYLLTVAYAFPEPGLDTDLFVKLPPTRPLSESSKQMRFSIAKQSQAEIDLVRLARDQGFPVPTTRYYFGDYSRRSLNYILITERIRFGKSPIEPAYTKGRDHTIQNAAEHYRVLARAQAKLVVAHKSGALGHDLEDLFIFRGAELGTDEVPDVEERIDRLIDIVGSRARHLFPEAATEPEFLERWREDLLFGMQHKNLVIDYLHADVDYTALCHPNLNIDNAWYWRNESDTLHTGLIDWGGAGQLSIAQALSNMLWMPDPEVYASVRDDVLEEFLAECASGGVYLDPATLRFHYRAAILSTQLSRHLLYTVEYLSAISEEDFRSMQDRFDPRLQESGLCSGLIWLTNVLQEWFEQVTPGDVCRKIAGRQA